MAPGGVAGPFYQRDARTNLAPVELRQIHPLGKSPVITEGDRIIAESEAIIDYMGIAQYDRIVKPLFP